MDQKFDRRDVYIITQNALADGTYLNYIRAQYNRSTQIDPPFFQELVRPEQERQDNYATNLLARHCSRSITFSLALGIKSKSAAALSPPGLSRTISRICRRLWPG